MSSKSWKSDLARSEPDSVTVGRVGKPHGVRGEVHVTILSDTEGRFDEGESLEIVSSEGVRRLATLACVRKRKGSAIVRFEEFSTRDEAELLRGAFLEVAQERVPPAPNGSYYFFQLVGCQCEDLGDGLLGTVTQIVDDGGGLILEIEGERGTLLVPFVSKYVRRVEVEERRIELNLPEGLVETCISRS